MASEPALETMKSKKARHRARQNVERWGQQSPTALMAAIAEETAELTDEIVPLMMPPGVVDPDSNEETPECKLWSAMNHYRAEGLHVQHILDNYAEPDEPVEFPERDMDVEEVREELYDLMALCYQLDWALYQGVRADE